ncbi:helix-turn-helix transcriptional regulator [Stappia taiwanensis]|uniref:Helix-turn-helix transcriptional regulator n=1 Tax=Stappia taiwanensis TaxID=992267 RepID=A0A838XLY6_9HYPH|nr:helix-turn-helix transcriptional regulator [Stappia taiwanensis]MBA4611132.1 helix-turn-helix transcriptional regulator [Stappia taiwanensis]
MVWLAQDSQFDPDSVCQPVFGIAARDLSHHDSGLHAHRVAQLLFARRGCMTITLEAKLCLLPPTRAVWIPAGLVHRAQMRTAVDYRSVYFRPPFAQDMPSQIEVFEVSDVLQATLERIAVAPLDVDWTMGAARNLLAVCMDEIRRAPRVPTLLPLPSDPRLARLDTASLPPSLGQLASDVGAGEKTIGRIFRRETGMSYQEWRQQWRLLKAYELLSAGTSISCVSQELGFAGDSAFISFFKHAAGVTPKRYVRSLNPGANAAATQETGAF